LTDGATGDTQVADKADKTSELLQAVLAASDEKKDHALRVLRGEIPAGSGQKSDVNGPLLLGMGAGAKFLGVSRATLWRVMRAGKIQRVELFAGSYRVRREDLEALALRRCSGQAAGRRDSPSTCLRASAAVGRSDGKED
jgi:hypothetical protein